MASRLKLQSELEELLGLRHVYYQSPESLKMEYPAIRYSKTDIVDTYANDKAYLRHKRYELVVIDYKPDNPVIEKILDYFPHSTFDRHYVSNNLHHDVITIYY